MTRNKMKNHNLTPESRSGLVWTDRQVDEYGRPCHGTGKQGEDLARAKKLLAAVVTDLSLLDASVGRLTTLLLMTMPDCLSKTVESMRKHKLTFWDRNRETNRAWLALNMTTEAKAGFRAFPEGPRGAREVDFVELRRRIAAGATWDDELTEAILPMVRGVNS